MVFGTETERGNGQYIHDVTVTHGQPPTCADSWQDAIVVHKTSGQMQSLGALHSGRNSVVVAYKDSVTDKTVVIKFSRTNARTIAPGIAPHLVAYAEARCDGWAMIMEQADSVASTGVGDPYEFAKFITEVYREAILAGVRIGRQRGFGGDWWFPKRR